MAKGRHPDALKRELRAWYIYDFANSAFFQSAATVRDTTQTRAPRVSATMHVFPSPKSRIPTIVRPRPR